MKIRPIIRERESERERDLHQSGARCRQELGPTPRPNGNIIIEERRRSPPLTEHIVIERPSSPVSEVIEETRTTDGGKTTVITRRIKSSRPRPDYGIELSDSNVSLNDHQLDSGTITTTRLPKIAQSPQPPETERKTQLVRLIRRHFHFAV